MEEILILVDKDDRAIGMMEKSKVHELGLLHRAFSIFILNSKGEILLQQRALSKYHSPGLWSNTCCSHPRYEELLEDACHRRLNEEMGMKSDLKYLFHFIYQVDLENNMKEHEYDHVFYGISDETPSLNQDEVMDWKYISIQDLEQDLSLNAKNYSAWLNICFPLFKIHLNQTNL